MSKDWTGNATSIYSTHGASNHSETDRAKLDYYATDPEAVSKLLMAEKFNHYIFEPACGGCHISKVLIDNGYDVFSSDIVQRDSEYQTAVQDFFEYPPHPRNHRDIITNPPYNKAKEFAEHALEISTEGVKVAMLLKLTFLEGVKRKNFSTNIHPGKSMYSGIALIVGRMAKSLARR